MKMRFYINMLMVFMLLNAVVVFLAGSAYAAGPEEAQKGLTFGSVPPDTSRSIGLFVASCDVNNSSCNPYKGDVVCTSAQSLLCFLDIDAPVPTTLSDPRYWTGGVFAASPPQKGTNFKYLADANKYCAAIFGDGWRVASFHDGGGWSVKGYGAGQSKAQRFWVDIKNQSNATCWAK